ncbi:hypothetical protein IKE83_00640 [Candidatus Saccharibacteria bacterium]|nr:hypothetical protein [Candidatus Saccharibacteria bacterium]
MNHGQFDANALLSETIRLMQEYDAVTQKFADVLTGRANLSLLGYFDKTFGKKFKLTERTKICLTKDYVAHMRNSGHFTGVGYGRNGHNDPHPLSLRQISEIPEIIRSISNETIIGWSKIRGRQRIIIVSKNDSDYIVVTEISKDGDHITLVTAYNKH